MFYMYFIEIQMFMSLLYQNFVCVFNHAFQMSFTFTGTKCAFDHSVSFPAYAVASRLRVSVRLPEIVFRFDETSMRSEKHKALCGITWMVVGRGPTL